MIKEISGTTKLAGLLGHPVAHSFSPAMHNTAFRELGLDCVYLCFDVEEEGLAAAFEGLRACRALGFNLTMPNKNLAAELADELSPAARLAGAVNTVVNDSGRLIGHITDGAGFVRGAKEAGFVPAGAEITVLGAGGAATAICAQLALDGADAIHVFLRPESRHLPRMQKLAEDLKKVSSGKARLTISGIGDESALRGAAARSSLLVNATSVGMEPQSDRSLIEDPSVFHRELLVADIIYQPRETKLLRVAREAGLRTMNGLPMLLYQGAEAFRLWTGRDMPVETVRRAVFPEL